jgi:lysophospholipase L1-like esterase
VKRSTLSDYRVVYFATHGLIAGEVKGLAEPSLALTLPKQPSEIDESGFLSTTMGSVCRTTDPKGPHLEDVIRSLLAVEEDLPPTNVINQGRDGEFLQGLLTGGRYEREVAKLPGIDFVLIRYGLNDLGRREDFANNFPKDFSELIGRLRKDFPDAAIIPVTIIPYFTPEVDEQINVLIRKVAEEEKLPLFDVYTRYQKELTYGANMLNYRSYELDKIPKAQREWVKPFVRDSEVIVVSINECDSVICSAGNGWSR